MGGTGASEPVDEAVAFQAPSLLEDVGETARAPSLLALGAALDGTAEGIPRPNYYSNLTKGQKKLWNRRHKWNGQYE